MLLRARARVWRVVSQRLDRTFAPAGQTPCNTACMGNTQCRHAHCENTAQWMLCTCNMYTACDETETPTFGGHIFKKTVKEGAKSGDASTAVELNKLTGLVPTILSGNARSFDQDTTGVHARGVLANRQLRDDMQTWNTLEFSGGGTELAFTTNTFDASNMPGGMFKDTATTTTRDLDCETMDAHAKAWKAASIASTAAFSIAPGITSLVAPAVGVPHCFFLWGCGGWGTWQMRTPPLSAAHTGGGEFVRCSK